MTLNIIPTTMRARIRATGNWTTLHYSRMVGHADPTKAYFIPFGFGVAVYVSMVEFDSFEAVQWPTTAADCPRCNGLGEIQGSTPHNSRVRYDDLSPDDYCRPCPDCKGKGKTEETA